MAMFAITFVTAFIAATGSASAQTLVERGSYLVNAVMACDGQAFKPPMARGEYFSRMTQADLDALVAWRRTIPLRD